jgi:hypothetical protein
VPEPLTAEERMTIKTAAFGAVFLVSNADPGVLAMVKESFAASGAIAGSSGLVRELLTTGGLPRLSSEAPAAVESVVLPALHRAMAILRVKAPDEVENYCRTVVSATEDVARASDGISASEAAMMAKIRDVLAGE